MQENQIKFSIIVPIYNVERYLRRCVDSLIGQTYRNIEIILIDDGSPDQCPEICDEYAAKDSRVQVIHKANGGVTSARKAGTEKASGDYILCVDGDDYVTADYIEKFSDVLKIDSPDVICCGFIHTDGRTEIKKPIIDVQTLYNRQQIEQSVFPSLIKNKEDKYFSYSLCGKAYKAKLFRDCICKESDQLTIGEDAVCIMAMMYRAESMAMITNCGYYYRSNLNSATKAKKPHSWNGAKLEVEYIQTMIDASGFDFSEQIDRLVAHRVFGIAITQFYRDEPYRVIKSDIEAHLNEPLYAEAIRNARFSGSWKAALMMFALRHRCCRLMQLWAKVKN